MKKSNLIILMLICSISTYAVENLLFEPSNDISISCSNDVFEFQVKIGSRIGNGDMLYEGIYEVSGLSVYGPRLSAKEFVGTIAVYKFYTRAGLNTTYQLLENSLNLEIEMIKEDYEYTGWEKKFYAHYGGFQKVFSCQYY